MFKIVHFSFFFLVVSLTRTDIPYKFLSTYSEICTDTVRSIRSGGYAHDFHPTEVLAQTIETVPAFV